MGNNHYRRKERGKQANILFGGREEKSATEYLCVLGATHNVWCSMANVGPNTAVVGATVVAAATVGSIVIGAIGWCAERRAAWCSTSVAVVGVTSGALYGAAVVQ